MLAGDLAAADRHYATMQVLSAAALASARRAWQSVNPLDVANTWRGSMQTLLTALSRLQYQAALAASEMVPAALAEQDLPTAGEALFRPQAMVGWASDGRQLQTLLMAPVGSTLDVLYRNRPPGEAWEAGRVTVERIARTQITDTGRVAAGVAVAVRPRTGWVRMLTPPSCPRCLILAGRFYRWSSGFNRHPNDDCVSIPSRESRSDDVRTDPDAYLRSLANEDQDRLLGKANAQAWRDGADLNQVVNARRGMETTADGIQVTTSGATAQGLAGQRLGATSGRTATRLVPESIYRLATDRADALRLLRLHGYIL